MRAQFFIHIGLPKTATTFLQWNVFPHIANVTFLGKAKCVDFYDLYNLADEKILISHEHLLACPWEWYPHTWLDEFSRRLEALARRFPSARIMLSFRKHEALLTSYYKEYISKPGRQHLSLDEFFDVQTNKGLVRHEELVFSELVRLVERHFEAPPFVYLFEDVVQRLPVFLEDLSAFFGEEVPLPAVVESDRVNPGVRYYQAKLLVRLNQLDGWLQRTPLVPGLYNPLFRKLSIEPDRLCRKHLAFVSRRPIVLTEEQKDFIREEYASDWKEIEEYVGVQRARLRNRSDKKMRAEAESR